jgi:hypothetical protein
LHSEPSLLAVLRQAADEARAQTFAAAVAAVVGNREVAGWTETMKAFGLTRDEAADCGEYREAAGVSAEGLVCKRIKVPSSACHQDHRFL